MKVVYYITQPNERSIASLLGVQPFVARDYDLARRGYSAAQTFAIRFELVAELDLGQTRERVEARIVEGLDPCIRSAQRRNAHPLSRVLLKIAPFHRPDRS